MVIELLVTLPTADNTEDKELAKSYLKSLVGSTDPLDKLKFPTIEMIKARSLEACQHLVARVTTLDSPKEEVKPTDEVLFPIQLVSNTPSLRNAHLLDNRSSQVA